MSHRVLIIEDEENLCWFLRESFTARGFTASYCLSGEEGLKTIAQERPDVVILDINLPGMDGVEVLRRISEDYAETLVFILTAYDSAELAVNCLQLGAVHYMTKPFDNHELVVRVEKAIDEQLRKGRLEALQTQLLREGSLGEIIGRSPAMARVFELIKKIAASDTTTVLVTGETGTGKETVAKAVHSLSARKDEPFLAVNCTALPETLLESELFGHEKGAFTGALRQRRGFFELAHKGSLFLDEIGDLSPGAQAKLLRVLQERKIMRLGGSGDIEVDVRIIAATNRDLEKLMQQGAFRDDLFYRLNVYPIHLPRLRDRGEDVVFLAEHFLRQIAREMGRSIDGFTSDALSAIRSAPWPGNVRQLRNSIERAVLLAAGTTIRAVELGLGATEPASPGDGAVLNSKADGLIETALEEEWTMAELERRYIMALLSKHNRHRGKVARILDLDPKTLYRRLKKYGYGSEDE